MVITDIYQQIQSNYEKHANDQAQREIAFRLLNFTGQKRNVVPTVIGPERSQHRRRKAGRAFAYRAAASREEIEGAVAADLVHSLLQAEGGEPLPILSSLVDAVSDRDRALLDELERLIREKRRRRDA